MTLEHLWALRDPELIDSYAGRLVVFRERAIGKGVNIPGAADEEPLGRVQFRVSKKSLVYRAEMAIKNMYVFSDTAALNLRNSRVCGVALLEDAGIETVKGRKEISIGLKPLILGLGGYGSWVRHTSGEHDLL